MYRQSGAMSAGAAVALGLIGATSLVLYTVLAQNLAPPTTTARPLVIGASAPAPTEPAGVKVASSSRGGGRHHLVPSVLTWLQRPLRAPASVAVFQPSGAAVTVALLSPPSAPPGTGTGGGTPPQPSPKGTPPPIPTAPATAPAQNHCGRSKGHRIHLPQGKGRGMRPYRGKGHVLHPCKSQGHGTPPADVRGHRPHPSNKRHGARGPAGYVRSGSGHNGHRPSKEVSKVPSKDRRSRGDAGSKGHPTGAGDSPHKAKTHGHAHGKPTAGSSSKGKYGHGHGHAGTAKEGSSGKSQSGTAGGGNPPVTQDLLATVPQPRDHTGHTAASHQVPGAQASVPASALEDNLEGEPLGGATTI